MATVYKILGQSRPLNTSNADLITVGASKYQVVSTLTVCNTTATAATFRAFATDGSSGAEGNAIAYDVSVAGNDSANLTIGITLDASDRLIVRAGTASSLTFTAFGSEIDA